MIEGRRNIQAVLNAESVTQTTKRGSWQRKLLCIKAWKGMSLCLLNKQKEGYFACSTESKEDRAGSHTGPGQPEQRI